MSDNIMQNGNGIAMPETKETMLLYKKKGFFIAKDKDPEGFYMKALAEIEQEGKTLITACSEDAVTNEKNINGIANRINEKIEELKSRRKEYQATLKEKVVVKKEIETNIEQSCKQLYDLFSQLGHKKANIVSTQLQSIKEEIFKIIETYRDIANDQNKQNDEEFKSAEEAREKSLAYAQQLEEELKERRDKVMLRLKILSRDGINPGNSRFLISTGWLAAFVAGWFFSVWAIPGAKIEESQNVKIFFIDNIGQWLSQFNWFVVLAGVAAYALLIGVVSWGCQKILNKNDCVEVSNKREYDHEFSFNSKNDNLMDLSIRGRNWWAFWLRITPVLVVIVPLVVMITMQINRDIGEHRQVHSFQDLFNDFFINLIGSFIAVCLSVFMFFYLSRVSEPAYHRSADDENPKTGFKIFHLGFGLYALMIGMMLFYPLFNTTNSGIKIIVITGFAASILATAFSLGYGYIFRGLLENLAYYNRTLGFVSLQIKTLSEPSRVSYTASRKFEQSIDALQVNMFELISSRHSIAHKLSGGRKIPNGVTAFIPSSNPDPAQKGLFYYIFHWRKKQPSFTGASDAATSNFESGCSISENEEFYFAEESKKIEALTARIKEDRSKLKLIESELRAYWRNEETWASLNSQLQNAENELNDKEKELGQLRLSTAVIAETVKIKTDQKKVWLSEGYYTGRWFSTDPGSTNGAMMPENNNLIEN